LLIPFLLLAIALSISFAEPLQEIYKIIQEFSSKLFSFFLHPIFIISIIVFFLTGVVFLIIFCYKSHLKYRRIVPEEKEKIKKFSEGVIELGQFDVDGENEKEFGEEEENIKEEALFEPKPIGSYGRNVNIRVDSNKRYFHKKNISKDEVKYLLNEDYQIRKYKNLLNGKMEDFILQPRHNESFTHLFLTHNISEFLEKNGIETELFVTKKPDIVFQIKNKKYAIEVETGSIFSKISRMKEKLEVLGNYDKWFFVVTDRNKVKKYKKYGDVVDKRYVKSRLDKLVKLAKKVQK
jgi:hypothetical protein